MAGHDVEKSTVDEVIDTSPPAKIMKRTVEDQLTSSPPRRISSQSSRSVHSTVARNVTQPVHSAVAQNLTPNVHSTVARNLTRPVHSTAARNRTNFSPIRQTASKAAPAATVSSKLPQTFILKGLKATEPLLARAMSSAKPTTTSAPKTVAAADDAQAAHTSLAAADDVHVHIIRVDDAAATTDPGVKTSLLRADAKAQPRTRTTTTAAAIPKQQQQQNTYSAAPLRSILQQQDHDPTQRRRPLDHLTLAYDRQIPLMLTGGVMAEQYLMARLMEHVRRITDESTGGARGVSAAWLCCDWQPTQELQLRCRDYSGVLPQMSDGAAQLPKVDDYQGRLHGVFDGSEDVRMSGERMRYLEELSRALVKTLASLQAACTSLARQACEIGSLELQREIRTNTIPAIVYPVADATALAVELMFSHVHVRRQNMLQAARATTVECVNALVQSMLSNQHLF